MTVAFGAKPVIVFATAWIILHADARPVVKRVAELNVAAIAHQHCGSFPTLSCNRRHAGETADQVVAVLGAPRNAVDLGGNKIYLFASMKVPFVGGQLTDAE